MNAGWYSVLFRDRHRELRAGWRLLIFLLLLGGGAYAALSLLPATFGAAPLPASVLMLGLAILVTWVVTRLVNRKPLASVGLWPHPRAVRECGMGLLLGFLMMTGIFLLEIGLDVLHLSWRGLTIVEVCGAAGISFMFFAFSAMFEELVFRGYLFQTLMQWVSFIPALAIMSLVFGLAHSHNPHVTVLSTANVILAGVWLSFAYLKTRSLWLPFGLHLSWNFSQSAIYAFPTSGFAFAERRLFLSEQTGPEWLTGGDFGPEGGVLATIALIAATWYVLKTPFLQQPVGIITLDSIEDVLPAPPRHMEGE